jgi:hypothetical protein
MPDTYPKYQCPSGSWTTDKALADELWGRHDARHGTTRRPSAIEQQCLTLDYAHAPHTWVSVHGDRLCHGVTVRDALTEVLEGAAKTERRIKVILAAEGPYAGPSEKIDAEREIRAWLECGGRP